MARPFGGQRRGVSQPRLPARRQLVWGHTVINLSTLTAGIPVGVGLLETTETLLGRELGELTVVRMRGKLTWTKAPQGSPTEGTSVRMSIGIGVFPVNMASTQILPVNEGVGDFMWWDQQILSFPAPTTTLPSANVMAGGGAGGLVVDVKSMRKLGGYQRSVRLVAETDQTQTYNLQGSLSLLLMMGESG